MPGGYYSKFDDICEILAHKEKNPCCFLGSADEGCARFSLFSSSCFNGRHNYTAHMAMLKLLPAKVAALYTSISGFAVKIEKSGRM